MYVKQRRVPSEVSNWLEKDLEINQTTGVSRSMNTDSRDNITLSRRFFTDMLNLSMMRHRKIHEHNHNQRIFLREQIQKSRTTLPGLRP